VQELLASRKIRDVREVSAGPFIYESDRDGLGSIRLLAGIGAGNLLEMVGESLCNPSTLGRRRQTQKVVFPTLNVDRDDSVLTGPFGGLIHTYRVTSSRQAERDELSRHQLGQLRVTVENEALSRIVVLADPKRRRSLCRTFPYRSRRVNGDAACALGMSAANDHEQQKCNGSHASHLTRCYGMYRSSGIQRFVDGPDGITIDMVWPQGIWRASDNAEVA